MSQGVFATPNIGNAGAEFYEVRPTEPDYKGIPTTFENLMKNTKPLLKGTFDAAAFVESRDLNAQADALSQQFQSAFEHDAAVQSSAKTLGQMKEAVAQGQMSTSSLLVRAKALQDKAKGLSPIYGAEIDEVFAKHGIDPNGRNGLGISKSNYETDDLKQKIKTAEQWHRDPNMSQYVVYTPGMEHTEDNINIKATLDNVAKVNDALRATERGVSSAVGTSLAAINSQLSNKMAQLQQASGDPAQIQQQQQIVVSQFRNQLNQLISYTMQNQAKFPPGSEQYKNLTQQIAAIRAFKEDIQTMTPQDLVAAETNAKMIGAQLSIVKGQYETNYIESGMKALVDASALSANGTIPLDDSELTLIQNKIMNGQALTPAQQQLYTWASSPNSYVKFLNMNQKQQSYSKMDEGITSTIAQTDSQSLNAFMAGAYNRYTDKAMVEDTKSKLANNAARLFDGVANTGMFIKTPDNFVGILKNTADNTQINNLLDTLPTQQRDVTAQNILKTANMAMTASTLPFSVGTLEKANVKVIVDERTDTVHFQYATEGGLANKLLNRFARAEMILNRNPDSKYVYGNIDQASNVWNNALQTMVNLSGYDPELKGKTKSEIVLEKLRTYAYPESLIEIKQ